MNIPRLILHILVAIAVLAAASLLAYLMIEAKSKPQKKQIETSVTKVNAKTFTKQNHTSTIETYGITAPLDQGNISPEVQGRLIWVSPTFRVGNTIKKGELIAKVDPADYETAVAIKLSQVAQAEERLAEQTLLGEQAAEDWKLSGRNIQQASPYVLRLPQIKSAQSTLASAKKELAKAELDLKRVEIKAPFDGIVTSRDVIQGRFVTPQTNLGSIISKEILEVPLAITSQQLHNLKTTKLPIPVRFNTPSRPEQTWKGNIVRISPSIDSKNQVGSMIAEIAQPFNNDPETNLPIGTFLNASLQGDTLEQCFALPQSAIVDKAFVWQVKTQENGDHATAHKVPVEIIRRKDGMAYCQIKDKHHLMIITKPIASMHEGDFVELKANR